ncbi:hypothetical protein DNTS_010165 [Danionella cerebrum]|uniref:Small ribosomal subunit protein mS29 n=1 Tax=Danionella cerebrum TaxID=2873325 RepID=A0A553Q6M8_9TELE|nr:hypothetical protein DNTS_010165 [Danionella translucida]
MNLPKLCSRLLPTVAPKLRHRRIQTTGHQLEGVAPELSFSEPNLVSVFRTSEEDPALHSETHLGQYYEIPPGHVQQLFPHGLPRRFQLQIKTFNEACVMVRPPSLELISCLKRADYSKPAQRYVLYGHCGTGKTMSLCHVLHYCYNQGWLILHVPNAHLWVKNCTDHVESSYNPSRYDQPKQAMEWLKNFKITNDHFLSKLKTTRRYVWTKREATEEGQPLGELVDQGLNRLKNSSDVVGALLRELKLQAAGGTFKLAVAVDGVNALWGKTVLRKMNREMCEPEELTLIYNLRKMMKNDWCGGAILTALSRTDALFKPLSAYRPSELLGEEGFDKMEPFVPLQTTSYNEKEFESCYLYYLDRNWLQHSHSLSEEGKKELVFLSNRNPSVLEQLCSFI